MRGRTRIGLGVAVLAALAGLVLWNVARRPGPEMPRTQPRARPALPAPDYEPLRRQVAEFVYTRPGVTFGIYFKDLVSGAAFGINADEPIAAASTVKVPIVLYLNTLAARGELDMSERVVYRQATDYTDGAGILQFTARDGDTYSLRALATLAITISDNVATRMLLRRLGRDNVASFMRGLGGATVYPGGENVTTARDMGAYVDGVLLFAREHPVLGSRLLDDMAHSIYHVGLPGRLPPGVMVAHKEGDVAGMAGDVGVVLGRRPYILCVLSRGIGDLDAAFADIAHISRLAYDFQERLPGGGR